MKFNCLAIILKSKKLEGVDYIVKQTIEERVAKLEEKVSTLFTEQEKLEGLLHDVQETQVELLKQVTNLTTVINTLKWTLTLFVTLFGAVFVFMVTEIIKIIH